MNRTRKTIEKEKYRSWGEYLLSSDRQAQGDIKELIWSIKGDGFQPTDNESFKGEQRIALSARKDLTKDTRVTITAKTDEGKEAKITVNIRFPRR